MTDTWDGRPENPEHNSWHWLHVGKPEDGPVLAPWSADIQGWVLSHIVFLPSTISDFGWRYLGPALNPAEVAAQVAAAYQRGQEDMRERAKGCAEIVPISADCHATEAHGRMMQSCVTRHLIMALPIKDAPHE